jgi:hypothetical protein
MKQRFDLERLYLKEMAVRFVRTEVLAGNCGSDSYHGMRTGSAVRMRTW